MRSSSPEVFCKNVLIEISQNSQEIICARVFFQYSCRSETCNFIKKETLAQVFYCELCEISKNNFFHRTSLADASDISNFLTLITLVDRVLYIIQDIL